MYIVKLTYQWEDELVCHESIVDTDSPEHAVSISASKILAHDERFGGFADVSAQYWHQYYPVSSWTVEVA